MLIYIFMYQSIVPCVFCVCIWLCVWYQSVGKSHVICQTYSKLDALLHKTHSKVLPALRCQGSISVSLHTFSQRNKPTKTMWGKDGQWEKSEKCGKSNIGVVRNPLPTMVSQKILLFMAKLDWCQEKHMAKKFCCICIFEMMKNDARQNCANEIGTFQRDNPIYSKAVRLRPNQTNVLVINSK